MLIGVAGEVSSSSEVVIVIITAVLVSPLEKVVEELATGGGAVIGTLLWGLRRTEFSEVRVSLFRVHSGDCPARIIMCLEITPLGTTFSTTAQKPEQKVCHDQFIRVASFLISLIAWYCAPTAIFPLVLWHSLYQNSWVLRPKLVKNDDV